ncbi:methionyl-tRNA formyltransferase [candidate division KSB1 bacterium]|nr:methionyl-tRNA formyltransferase [candidate division KSB1 bacterium]
MNASNGIDSVNYKLNKTRIVFMGTPDFAVESAETLAAHGAELAAVVTVPDKAAGRGLQVRESAVKAWAKSRGFDILQPENLRDPDFISVLQSISADLFVVVAFRILPPEVFKLPRLGTINLHASLLPKYRGAAPINWALIHGEKTTGVTTFMIDEHVDTGDFLLKKSTDIGENETFGELYSRLKSIGAELLIETVQGLVEGTLQPQKQLGEATKAPKLTNELRQINWQQSAKDIRNLVRGLSPIPAAVSTLQGKTLKIFACSAGAASRAGKAGEVIAAENKKGILEVHAGDDTSVCLQDVQMQGKKRMLVDAFLRGYQVNTGEILGSR